MPAPDDTQACRLRARGAPAFQVEAVQPNSGGPFRRRSLRFGSVLARYADLARSRNDPLETASGVPVPVGAGGGPGAWWRLRRPGPKRRGVPARCRRRATRRRRAASGISHRTSSGGTDTTTDSSRQPRPHHPHPDPRHQNRSSPTDAPTPPRSLPLLVLIPPYPPSFASSRPVHPARLTSSLPT
jgi:hypothetical protein